MPYMQRLTWTGIAMHAGKLPGYPASAGCIRMPLKFSELIYGIMQNGSTVVITQKKSNPTKSAKPSSILLKSKAPDSSNKAVPQGVATWEPEKSPHGPISVLLSYADKTIYVWRNGVQIGQSPVDLGTSDKALPEGVFLMLEGSEKPHPRFPDLTIHPWSVLSLDQKKTKGDVVTEMRERFSLPDDFRAHLSKALQPGAILVSTSDASTTNTRSGVRSVLSPDQ